MGQYRSLLLVCLFVVAAVSVGIAGCNAEEEAESAPDADQPQSDATTDACTPESDEAFCKRIGTECGSVIADDNCGDQRSVGCDVECPTCDGVEVSLDDGDGGSLSVDPTSVDEDGDVVFSWTSTGACHCSGSLQGADWPAWDDFEGPPEGSTTVSVSELANDSEYTACIECCNGQNCDDRCAQFTVWEDDEGSSERDCSERVPSHANRATDQCILNTSGVDCTSWVDYWNRDFGEPTTTRELALEWDEYLALEFDTSTMDTTAEQRILRESGKAPGRKYIATISHCPGDFDLDAIEHEMKGECYREFVPLASSIIRWVGADVNDEDRCVLDPDETYYWNVIYTDSEAGTDPDDLNLVCEDTPTQTCGHLIQVSGS